jgi:uncharacterized protein YndB with AHSA1/START domain
MTAKKGEGVPGKERGTVSLVGDHELVVERRFDAPRGRVYAALIDPKLVPQWWGPARLTTVVERMDVRVGGTWRILQREAEGTEYAFHGEYRDVESGTRIVRTFEFEGAPGQVLVESTTLEDDGAGTKMRLHVLFPTRAARDGMTSAGMEDGMREGWDRFDALVSEA